MYGALKYINEINFENVFNFILTMVNILNLNFNEKLVSLFNLNKQYKKLLMCREMKIHIIQHGPDLNYHHWDIALIIIICNFRGKW